MKFTKLLFIPFVALLACSKSESPTPLQNTKVLTPVVTPPAGLSASFDSHAQEAAGYFDQVNFIAYYSLMFAYIPAGATKSPPITATNGRVAATSNTTATYVWSDGQDGSVALQVTDEGTSYLWEYFVKTAGAQTWLKFSNTEMKKDNTQGTMKIFTIPSDIPGEFDELYEWTKVSGVLNFHSTDNFTNESFQFTLNTSTKAGSVNAYNGNGANALLSYTYTWVANGTGTWTAYDTDGTTVIGSGTW